MAHWLCLRRPRNSLDHIYTTRTHCDTPCVKTAAQKLSFQMPFSAVIDLRLLEYKNSIDHKKTCGAPTVAGSV